MAELQQSTQLARHQFDVLNAEISEKKESSEKMRVESELCNESVVRGEMKCSSCASAGGIGAANRRNLATQPGAESRSTATTSHSFQRGTAEGIGRAKRARPGKTSRKAKTPVRRAGGIAEMVTERLAGATAALEQHRQR